MAVVRKKNKQTGLVSWLSLTTALLEIERDAGGVSSVIENQLKRTTFVKTPYAVYEYMD